MVWPDQNLTTMKTQKSLSRVAPGKVLVGLLLLLSAACSDPINDVSRSSTGSGVSNLDDWVAVLDKVFYDAGIIVEEGGSIQQAVDAANTGDVIYIEPGFYDTPVTIGKSGITLVGLENGTGQRVVLQNSPYRVPGSGDIEIINIQGGTTPDSDNQRARKRKKTCTVKRNNITNTIAHYEFEVPVGDSPYGIVRLHRVVKESKPFHPVRTRGSVFMLHGASLSFESVFLNAGT